MTFRLNRILNFWIELNKFQTNSNLTTAIILPLIWSLIPHHDETHGDLFAFMYYRVTQIKISDFKWLLLWNFASCYMYISGLLGGLEWRHAWKTQPQNCSTSKCLNSVLCIIISTSNGILLLHTRKGTYDLVLGSYIYVQHKMLKLVVIPKRIKYHNLYKLGYWKNFKSLRINSV